MSTGATRPDLAPLPSAADIVRYMRATGWAHGRQGSHGAMWTRGDVEFSVPHEDHNPAWLREVIARLASAEGRTPEATAAAIAEYRDARGPEMTAGVPAVTSPAPAPAGRSGTATGPSSPVSDAAVQAALDVVALFWKEAHAVLQAYPSAALARAMLEGAAPLIRADAEAKLAEVRQTIAAFFTHHGNSSMFALRSARDLAEGIRQVLDRAALTETPEEP